MTKRRLAPKEQQLVEDYLTKLNRLQSMPIFDKMSLTEVAKHITSVLQEQDRERADMREQAAADVEVDEDTGTAITQRLEQIAIAVRTWREYSREHFLPCSLWLSTEGRDRRIGFGLWGILFIWRD